MYRECVVDRCVNPAVNGSRCADHGGRRKSKAAQGRDSLYKTAEWRERRKRQLAAEPNCRACGRPATVADHVIPVGLGGDWYGELQSLCKRDHDLKSAAEGRRVLKERAARRNRR
jgi:hypothetical protein